jgi:hypothetical protein
MGCCGLALAVLAWGQAKGKPGLWEVTMQMSMDGAGAPQTPQPPPGAQLPPGKQTPSSLEPFTTQVCLTQAMIDKYEDQLPTLPGSTCQRSDVVTTPNGMTVKLTCTGQVNVTGTAQATFADENTIKSTIHMTGTIQKGSTSRPVDVTIETTSFYKGADCGSVKPVTMPASQ